MKEYVEILIGASIYIPITTTGKIGDSGTIEKGTTIIIWVIIITIIIIISITIWVLITMDIGDLKKGIGEIVQIGIIEITTDIWNTGTAIDGNKDTRGT